MSAGCFVSGLYLEGAGWDQQKSHLIKQKPKQLIQDLPVLKVIPIEAHRLKLQVNCKVLRDCSEFMTWEGALECSCYGEQNVVVTGSRM